MQERGPVTALRTDDPPADAPSRGPGTTPPGGRRRLLATLGVAAAVVLGDQVTKSLALAHLEHPVHLLGPLGLGLTYNSGAAFSLFTGDARVLAGVAIGLIVLLGFLAWRTHTAGLAVGLGLVLGGALGNLADRVFRHHHHAVVDFITLSHWPTFNVADACITVGVVVVVVTALRRPARARGR